MKNPKIDWPNDKQTQAVLEDAGLTKAEIEERIRDAIRHGEEMTKRGLDMVAPILRGDRDTWEREFNGNATLTKWFGRVNRPNHVKDVHRHLEDVHDRLANKELTVKVRDLRDADAQNAGDIFSPNTFKVGPGWAGRTFNERASVVAHELWHRTWGDRKIDGDKVYGSALAQKLASEDPNEARRSPENYEQFILELQVAEDAKAAAGTTSGSRR